MLWKKAMLAFFIFIFRFLGLFRLEKLLAYLPRKELTPIDIPVTVSTRELESRLSKESGFDSGPSSFLASSTSPESTARSFVKIREQAAVDDQKSLDEKLAIIAGQRKSDALSSVASRESYGSSKSDDTIINMVFESPERRSVESFETTIFRPDGTITSEGIYRIER